MPNEVKVIKSLNKISQIPDNPVDEIDGVLSSYIDSIPDNIEKISRSNCKLCQSEKRNEAEQQYMDSREKARPVYLWLKKEGVDISYPSVKNHLEQHFARLQKTVRIKEYLTQLKEQATIGKSKKAHLALCAVIMEDRLLDLASAAPQLGPLDQTKIVKSIKDISDSLISIYTEMEKTEQQVAPIAIAIERLHGVVKVTLQQVQNPEARKAIAMVMDQFQHSVNDLLVQE